MTNDIDKLKDDYRAIKAPPHLATRVRAQVKDTRFRRYNWVPAGATAMAIVAVFWLVPLLSVQTTSDSALRKPSLTSIAALKPTKPQGTPINLAQIRTVSRPSMPERPRIKTTKPQTRLDTENELLEEKDHAYI